MRQMRTEITGARSWSPFETRTRKVFQRLRAASESRGEFEAEFPRTGIIRP